MINIQVSLSSDLVIRFKSAGYGIVKGVVKKIDEEHTGIYLCNVYANKYRVIVHDPKTAFLSVLDQAVMSPEVGKGIGTKIFNAAVKNAGDIKDLSALMKVAVKQR